MEREEGRGKHNNESMEDGSEWTRKEDQTEVGSCDKKDTKEEYRDEKIHYMHRTTSRENVEGYDDMSHCIPQGWVISNCKNLGKYYLF